MSMRSDYTRGLIQGILVVFILWQIDTQTDLPWWLSILIAIAVGLAVGLVTNLRRRTGAG